MAGAAIVTAGLIITVTIVLPPMITAANETAHLAALAKAQADVPRAPLGDETTSGEQATLAQSDTAGGQLIATEQAREAAAAALAAQQAAAQAAYATAHTTPTHEWTVTHLPPVQSVDSGQPVPFVYDPAPQDADHGYYDTNACKSSSGTTINGISTCE